MASTVSHFWTDVRTAGWHKGPRWSCPGVQFFLYAHSPLVRTVLQNSSLEDAELIQSMLIFYITCRLESVWWTLCL